MALHIYQTDIGGIPHTLQLSEDDAKARGLTSKDRLTDAAQTKLANDAAAATKAASAPDNKAAEPPANK